MPDINLPGVSSNIDVKGIIDKLVSVEGRKLDRFEQQKTELDRTKSAWITLNTKIKDLQSAAESLHGFRSPFEDKIALSVDESVFTATAMRIAEPQTAGIKVIQTAQSERIVSDPVDSNRVLDRTLLKIRVGGRDFNVDFPGGKLEKLAEDINKQAGDYVSAKITKNTGTTSVLIIESKKTGESNRIRIEDPGTISFFKGIGVFEERPEFTIDTGLVKEKIVPRDGAPAGFGVTEGVLTLDPKNSVELPLPRGVDGKPELILKAKIRAVDVVKREPGAPVEKPVWPELEAIGKVTVRDVDVFGGRPVPSVAVPEKKGGEAPVFETAVFDDSVIGLGNARDLTRMAAAGELSGTFKEYSFKLSDILGPGETADRVLFINRNTGRKVEFRDVVIEDATGRGGIVPKNLVQEGRDAVITIDGVQVQREGNQIDDAIKGVKLDLKGPSGKEIPLTVRRDYETITKRIVGLIEKYNDVLKFINEQTNVVSSGRLTEKNEVGTLTGDITVMGLKNRLQTIMMNPYPTERGRELSILAQIGVSMGNTGSDWKEIRGGYLQVDENKFVEAFEQYPDSIRQLFGSDNDNDMAVDSGVAYTLEKNLKPYTESRNGIVATRISTTDNGIKQQDEKISDWKDHLDEYRKKLERDFTVMQQSLNELEQNQKRIQNFSNQSRARE